LQLVTARYQELDAGGYKFQFNLKFATTDSNRLGSINRPLNWVQYLYNLQNVFFFSTKNASWVCMFVHSKFGFPTSSILLLFVSWMNSVHMPGKKIKNRIQKFDIKLKKIQNKIMKQKRIFQLIYIFLFQLNWMVNEKRITKSTANDSI
jgi:hypothetical protein